MGCKSNVTPIEQICERCKAVMLDEVDKWYQASKILANHKRNTQEEANEIITGMDDLRKVALKSNLKWEPDSFRIEEELFTRLPRKTGKSSKSRSSTVDESKSIESKLLKSPFEVRSQGTIREADSDCTSMNSNAHTCRNFLQHADVKANGKFDFKASKNAKFGLHTRKPSALTLKNQNNLTDRI